VKETSEDALRNMDFWLEQSFDAWKDMLDNIKKHGAADLAHTLNTLDLNAADSFARSYNGYRLDTFHRFNQSLQDWFNASAKLDTKFVEPAAVA
jgi:hypothetical protein